MLYRLDNPARARRGSTRLEINLDVIGSNYRKILAQISPARVMAVIKDNAYGHGLQPVASRLCREGCRDFAVATLVEALLLEQANIPPSSVLILRTLTGAEMPIAGSVASAERMAGFGRSCRMADYARPSRCP